MDKKELMIGNVVGFYDTEGSYRQGWVDTIGHNKAIILTVSSYRGTYDEFRMMQGTETHAVKYNNLFPVKLTDLELDRLGFKSRSEGWSWTRRGVDIYSNGTSYSYHYSHSFKLEFVHELQNLYQLINKTNINYIN